MIADEKFIQDTIEKEGNNYEFIYLGLPVLMKRCNGMWWCGYVGVPKESRLYGRDYYISSSSENGLSECEKAINDIDVHGGLTYAGKRKNDEEADIWYFGFDCAHSGDWTGHRDWDSSAVYRDKEYVIEECKKLAKQIKKITTLYS